MPIAGEKKLHISKIHPMKTLQLTDDDIEVILEMACICFSEGIGPNFNPLLKKICESNPLWRKRYPYMTQENENSSNPTSPI